MRNGYERDGTFVRSAGTHGVDVSCGWMAGWLVVGGWWLVVLYPCSLFQTTRWTSGRLHAVLHDQFIINNCYLSA
jgi:hypothetical protein